MNKIYIIAKCDDSTLDLGMFNAKFGTWDEAVEALLDIVSSFNGYDDADEWKADPENEFWLYSIRNEGNYVGVDDEEISYVWQILEVC